jgi:hypothetical protein
MKPFENLFEWYKNLDVLLFVESVEKIKTLNDKNIDLFKQGVLLPGLVLKYQC